MWCAGLFVLLSLVGLVYTHRHNQSVYYVEGDLEWRVDMRDAVFTIKRQVGEHGGLTYRYFPPRPDGWSREYTGSTSGTIFAMWWDMPRYSYDDSIWGGGSYNYSLTRAVVPLWPFTILALAVWLIAWLQPLRLYDHWRHPPGTCRACGYDLRASTDACPECGKVVGFVNDGPTGAHAVSG